MRDQIEHRFPIPRHDDRFALLDLSSKFGQAIFRVFDRNSRHRADSGYS
jgi:hypothetical protein